MDGVVRFLTHTYDARRSDLLRQSECPPAPDRWFQALVAAAHAHESAEDLALALRWLTWLEAQEPPTILMVPTQARTAQKVSHRPRPLISSGKKREPNPKIDVVDLVETPLADPLVVFRYRADLPAEFAEIARTTAALVPYLGTSASPVVVTIEERAAISPEHHAYVPQRDGTIELPVPYPGRIRALDASHADFMRWGRKPWEPRVRTPGASVMYADPEHPPEARRDVAEGDLSEVALLAFRRESGTPGPLLDVAYFPHVVAAARRAFLRNLGSPAPGILTGHADDGGPYQGTHVAFLPLFDAAIPYASGRLRGVGLALPRDLDPAARQRAYLAFNLKSLTVGGTLYDVDLLPAINRGPIALQPRTYRQRGAVWATTTPLRTWRMPRRNGKDLSDLVADALTSAGFPAPAWVETSPAPFASGARHVAVYRQACASDAPFYLVHARFGFVHAQEVAGPLLIGRGRFVGFGLCLPERPAAA